MESDKSRPPENHGADGVEHFPGVFFGMRDEGHQRRLVFELVEQRLVGVRRQQLSLVKLVDLGTTGAWRALLAGTWESWLFGFELLAREPQNPEAHLELAKLWLGKRRPNEALGSLEVAVDGLSGEYGRAARRLLAVEAKRSGQATVLKLRTDGEPVRYEVKEVQDPPRLVVDLFGVRTKLRRPTRLDDPHLRQVRIDTDLERDRERVTAVGRGF